MASEQTEQDQKPENDRLFVPLTDEWWEPIADDSERYRTVEPCDDRCHHPVHAFGHPERLRHTEDAAWIRRNAVPSIPPASSSTEGANRD